MKKAISLLFLFSAACLVNAQTNNPSTVLKGPVVDTRVELLSILFRLAGNNEYNHTFYTDYINDIHAHFDAFKDHETVIYAKKLASENSIGYDAIASMSICMKPLPDFGLRKIKRQESLDERWNHVNMPEFFAKLKKFYTDAQCDKFFTKQADRYATAITRFQTVMNQLDLNWYSQFYGTVPKGSFNVILGLSNGGNNYGPSIRLANGSEELFAIMGTWTIDKEGKPLYNANSYFPTLLHEFNHSFCNPIIQENTGLFSTAAANLYNEVKDKMAPQAYANWDVMIKEALVRAAVIRYMIDHTFQESNIQAERVQQLSRGFYWINEWVELLGTYQNNRQQFATLAKYLPNLATSTKTIAGNIAALKTDFLTKCPRIVSLQPFANGASSVDTSITEITFHFDKPLAGIGASINYGKGGKESYPNIKLKPDGYSNDKMSYTIQVKLKPATTYQFIVTGASFKTPDRYPLIEYPVEFTTAK
jgi:hypothetical protein